MQPEQPAGAKTPIRITIIGVGGAGSRVLRRLAKKPIPGVQYVVCDVDLRSLDLCPANVVTIEMGQYDRSSWYRGEFNPETGRQMAEMPWFKRDMKGQVKNADLLILAAGMGGVIGGGASPVIARTIKETNALLLAFVTTPFSFEGQKRRQEAAEAVQRLGAHVDNMIVIDDDRTLQDTDKDATIAHVFSVVDEVMGKGILSVVEPLSVPDTINTDISEVKKVMRIPGRTVMAIGRGSRPECPCMDAATNAIAAPLAEADLSGARGVLLSLRDGLNIGLGEYNEALTFISSKVKPDAPLVFGISYDREWGTVVDLTLIATGIEPQPRGLLRRAK